MRILGIDCGTVVTGYGVIDTDGSRHTLVEAGFDVPLFTCDGPGAFRRGSVAKTFPVANFPEGPEENLKELRGLYYDWREALEMSAAGKQRLPDLEKRLAALLS